ncbi:hypothetical protein [Pseudomonas viridiflava]|uniref:hypothetical protein n=1 Tax=Pseudomonas viridiflava TaxID=33069 RepID=UPI002E981C63|nr:hypothetical protein [Pseudomonas viridiflava]
MQHQQCSTSKAPARLSRKPTCQWAVLAAAILLPISSGAFATASPAPPAQGIKAFRLCTGPDNLSHVIQGTLDQSAVADVSALNFKETPAHATYDWHPAPQEQYVITLSGTLEFSATGGENFVLHPGEVLLAQDTTGLGHRWKLIDDQPWRRAYILTKSNAAKAFIAKPGSYDKGGGQA